MRRVIFVARFHFSNSPIVNKKKDESKEAIKQTVGVQTPQANDLSPCRFFAAATPIQSTPINSPSPQLSVQLNRFCMK